VDLLFIDANHFHPWPALDLMATLHLLKKEAWVVLHDIRLPFQSEHQVHGPMHLFDFWKGEKLQSRKRGNIGGIRLHEDPEKTISNLKEILAIPWESGVEESYFQNVTKVDIPIPKREKRKNDPIKKIIPLIKNADREVFIWGAGACGKECMTRLKREGIDVRTRNCETASR